MGIQYSKSPIQEDRNSEWPDEDQSPWLTTLKDVFRSASQILCSVAKASYHVLRGIYYGAYYILQGLYHMFKGVFYSIRGLIYFLVGFFGKQGTAILLASLAVLGMGYYVYTKDPNFAHQHVQIIENKGTKYVQSASSKVGDLVNKTSGNMSSRVGDLSSKVGDLSSKAGEFVSKGKNNIWAKFDWSK